MLLAGSKHNVLCGGLVIKPFFVAGLPRSRTAWLSVFLSQSGRHCWHDGMNGCRTIAEYMEKIGDGGDSSTGLHLFAFNELYPNSNIIVIEKSQDEIESCINWVNKTYGIDSRADIHRQNELLLSTKGLRVKQSEINSRLEEIFTYLTGDEWQPRYENIASKNIQADPYSLDYDAAMELMSEGIY